MKTRTFISGVLMTVILSFGACAQDSGSDSAIFDIPFVEGISIDGDAGDWQDRGFRVEFLTDPEGRSLPADDFDAKFRLGWNSEGLLVLSSIRDDRIQEDSRLRSLWRCDCVEVSLAADKGSDDNRFSAVFVPGGLPSHPDPRSHIVDWRPEDKRATVLTTKKGSRLNKNGYTLEILLPWSNLGMTPEQGRTLGFQFLAHDFEGNSQGSESLRVAWFPEIGLQNPDLMHSIRLSEKASPPVLYRVSREIVSGRCRITLRGSEKMAGRRMTIRSGKEILSEETLEINQGRAEYEYSLPAAEGQTEWPSIEILLDKDPAIRFPSLPLLETVISNYLSALGGRESLTRLLTRKQTGILRYEYPDRNPRFSEIKAEVIGVSPEKWRLVLTSPKGQQQMGYDGERGWLQNSDRILIDNSQRDSRLAYVFGARSPLRLKDFFTQMTLVRKEKIDGRFYYVIESTSHRGERKNLYFDADNGLLTWLGKDLKIADYREVEGIKHPSEIAIQTDHGTATYIFDEIMPNVPVDEAQMNRPTLEEVFPEDFAGLDVCKALPLLKDFPSGHEDMNVPSRDGRFLHDLILKNGYKRGLEIGTFTGYSALWMGLAFEKNGGRLFTVEIDEIAGGKARKNIQAAGLEKTVDARIADAFKEIPRIEGDFDYIFIDAWKPDYLKFFHLLRDRVKPGGAIVAHNVTNYARDMQDYLDAIRNDPGLETTFNELSGEGMSISIVRR